MLEFAVFRRRPLEPRFSEELVFKTRERKVFAALLLRV